MSSAVCKADFASTVVTHNIGNGISGLDLITLGKIVEVKSGKTVEVKRPHTSRIQEMPQYHSSMFSDAVYVFGNTFSSAPTYWNKEELPDGSCVNKSALAVEVVLAAFR